MPSLHRIIDVEYGTYWTPTVWGNADGYLKADG